MRNSGLKVCHSVAHTSNIDLNVIHLNDRVCDCLEIINYFAKRVLMAEKRPATVYWFGTIVTLSPRSSAVF